MRLIRVGLFVVLLALAPAAPASAHAAYRSSNPANGATVSAPPSQVTAEFTEPVTRDSWLEVVDPCGQVVSGASQPFNDTITVSMSGSRSGTYTVNFSVLSALDGHGTDGSFSFSSTGGDPCPGSEPPPEPPPGGNGGNNPGPGPGGTQSDPGTSTNSDPGSTSAEGPSSSTDQPSGTSGDPSNPGDQGRRGGRRAVSRAETGGERINLAQDRGRKKQPPFWEDIPVNALLIGLTVSALIGAAGGRIYAGIMGPRRL